jgi:MYXO-CTERM domain-containing protein
MAGAVAVLGASNARANGRFPASNQIVFSPTNPDIIIGRATYAILPSTDNGKTWQYLCEDALALPGSYSFEDPEFGLTYENSLVAGLPQPTVGLDVSPDFGCNWKCIGGPLSNQNVRDIVVRPDVQPDGSAAGQTSHEVLALTSTPVPDAGMTYSSQVFQSSDDGQTWNAVGSPLDSTVLATTIDVSKTNPSKIFVSGTRGYFTGLTASLFVSENNGTTWSEYPVGKIFNQSIPCVGETEVDCPSEYSIFIAGVDPNDDNIVYLRSEGIPGGSPTPGYSNLYVTTDGGKTFQLAKSFTLGATMNSDYLQSGEMLGFALSPDGSQVFIGTKETGIWSAAKADLMSTTISPTAFTNVNPKIQCQCLATRQTDAGMELWACGSEINDFVFGKSTDDGKSFTTMMATITSMGGPIACSASGSTSSACFTDANASQCACSTYQMFCMNIEPCNACLGCDQDGGGPECPGADGGPAPGGAGGPDGATGAADGGAGGSKGATAPKASCGCSVVGGGGAAGFLASAGLGVIAVKRRRRHAERR